MINKSKEVIAAFKAENIEIISSFTVDSNTKIPCFTYNESGNADNVVGNTLGYSDIQYTIEVWDNNYARLTENCKTAHKVMKKLAFVRISSIEQQFNNLYRKIMTYDLFDREVYKQ